MLQSVMVFPNNNDFFSLNPLMDDSMSKVIHQDHIESYMASASASPVQDYLIDSAFHPQQQHQNQRQQQSQFPVSMASMIAPNSPPYPLKNEDNQQQSMDYLLFQQIQQAKQQQLILPSQRSPQLQQQQQQGHSPQRMLPFADVSLLQQHQQHQQQQHQQHQQLRLQHQQRALERQQQQQYQQQQYQQNMMSTVSTTSSLTIPVTSSIMSTMASTAALMTPSASSSNMFTPSSVATSAPFFHPSTLVKDDNSTSSVAGPQKMNIAAMTFQQRHGQAYAPAAHPASPKRKIEETGSSDTLSTPPVAEDSTLLMTPTSINTETFPTPSNTPIKKSSTTTSSSRISTSSRLEMVKPARSTRVSKTTAARPAPKKMSKKAAAAAAAAAAEGVQEEPLTHLPNSTGNITHPRRAAQNRAAQRTFRNRRKAYIKELEQKVQEMDRTKELLETVHHENQEVWRRLQILESLASQNGLALPAFPALAPVAPGALPFFGSNNHENSSSNNGTGLKMENSGDDDDEEEEDDQDEEMGDLHLQQHAQTMLQF